MNWKVVIWGVLCLVVTGRAEEIQMNEGTTAIPSENNPAQTTVATETQQDQVSEDKHPKLFVWKVGQVDYASENMVHGDTIRTVQDVKLVSQCAMHARNTKDAMSFNFNKEQRICQINSESDTSKPASMRTEDGWQYFRQGTFQINQEAYGMCVTFPCMNGGECLDVVTSEGAMHYVCLCSPEYTGNTCEMPADSAEWGDWGEWSVCSVTCGRGYQTRNRPCVSKLDHSNTYNEMNCYGASSEFRECVPKECPAWDMWSDWSDCTTYTSCGRGYRERTRKCTNGGSPNVDRMCMGATNETEPCYMPNCHGMIRLQGGDGYGDGTVEVYNDLTEQWTRVCSTDLTKASADVCCRQLGFFDGASQGPTAALDGSVTSYFLTHIACTGSESSVQSCKHAGWPQTAETCDSSPAHIRCIVNGDWNNWSEWGDCSVTCENGIQVRTRTCDYPAPANGGQSCQGHAREEKPCTLPNCPVDGSVWRPWGQWTECSATCDGGEQSRLRMCDNQITACAGKNMQTQSCNSFKCEELAVWSHWSLWSECGTLCGPGTTTRHRQCNVPYDDLPVHCRGHSSEFKPCESEPCPQDELYWLPWVQWQPCNATCAGGLRMRQRHAACVADADCDIEDSQTQLMSCNTHPCPVDGEWKPWADWDTCNETCGGGWQQRTRECQKPKHGGDMCPGSSSEIRSCNTHPCPVDGYWKSWQEWQECSEPCGGGKQNRTRDCVEPLHGGTKCLGAKYETRDCNTHECSINCVWNNWGEWEACNTTCGAGSKRRSRTFKAAQFGGIDCAGSAEEWTDCFDRDCPIDCMWHPWSDWASCNVTCGSGMQKRVRTKKTVSQHDGIDCAGEPQEWRSCNPNPCPVDCLWNPWSDWASCNVTCGGGMQKRLRTKKQEAEHSGVGCAGDSNEWRVCNDDVYCPVDGVWEEWSDWDTCSKTCGNGTQDRTRKCTGPFHDGLPCDGPTDEQQECYIKPCPVDGVWREWAEWSLCSRICGGGTKSRDRECEGPYFDGTECPGSSSEIAECNTHKCPENGYWEMWSSWSECNQMCGTGSQSRVRECIPPKNGGSTCDGIGNQDQECNTFPCPVDGVWDSWSEWDECSVLCGGGSQSRFRSCIEPLHGGKPCTGPNQEQQTCNENSCAVDGTWNAWSDWDTCNVTCGGGAQMRMRTCNEPLHGGADCPGDSQDWMPCNTHHCPIDGIWKEWSDWHECDVTCAGGIQFRFRDCIPPKYDGLECPGANNQSQDCNIHPCPVDGYWGEWAEWQSCNVSCGGGGQVRNRVCIQPLHGGTPCKGPDDNWRECNTHNCPIDCVWDEWSEWEACNVTCSNGHQRRLRTQQVELYGGAACEGSHDDWRPCFPRECPVDCYWDPWTEWEACSVTCGNGEHKRIRIKHPELHGGNPCQGTEDEWRDCFDKHCPIDCVWNEWSEWSECNVTCEEGSKLRTRTKVPAKYDGLDCPGNAEDWKTCNDRPCPTDCEWSLWTTWTSCSMTCGKGGATHRTRDPLPHKNGGAPCVGEDYQRKECFAKFCPVDGYWLPWYEWGECSTTCDDGGVRARTRVCIPPQYGGNDCPGEDTQTETCQNEPCPIPGEWGEWSSWSTCTVSCEGGTRFKKRECNMTSYGWLTVPCEGNDTIWGTCNKLACLPRATTCGQLVERGLDSSMYVEVDPDGGELDDQRSFPPFYIYCDVEAQGGIGVAILHHNAEGRYIVQGFEGAGEYHSVLQYLDKDNATVHLAQVIAYVDASKECKQYISWECQSASIHSTIAAIPIPLTYWKNRYQLAKYYWGGNDPDYDGCQCGLTGTCGDGEDPDLKCNCDMNDEVWRKDDGWITHKDDLPISSIEAGDTGDSSEIGYYQVGTLYCW